MNRSIFQGETLDQVSEEETRLLRDRLQWTDEDAPVGTTIQAVAEAAGVTDEEVRSFLRSIRAEQAFIPAKRSPTSPYIALGVVALLAAGAITYLRLQGPAVQNRITPAPPTSNQANKIGFRNPPLTRMIQVTSGARGGVGHPPLGFQVEVISNEKGLRGDSPSVQVFPTPYEYIANGLQRTAEELIRESRGLGSSGSKVPIRDWSGNLYVPSSTKSSLTLSGWPGTSHVEVNSSLDAEGVHQIREAIQKLLSARKLEQDQALDLNAKPDEKGVIGPPPGLTVDFGGYQSDTRTGPRIAFAPIDLEVAADRLVLSVLNAMERDRAAVAGTFPGQPVADHLPEEARVAFGEPPNLIEFDVPDKISAKYPTQEVLRAAALRILKEKAREAVKILLPINAKARTVLTDGKPSNQ